MTARRPNYIAGVLTTIWLLIVLAPIWVLIKGSFQNEFDYSNSGPLSFPHLGRLTTQNFSLIFSSGFLRYFLNTGIVVVAVVLIVVVLVPPIAFAVVRNRSRTVTFMFRVFLMGLAIPIQVVLIPIFYMIQKVGLYDQFPAIILPTAAFSIPISVIIMTGAMRDITPDMYEAMALDGATSWRTFWNLVMPLSRGALATVIIFSALNAWNGFIFPLILTQSENVKVFTLALFNFNKNNSVNAPAITAAVVLSIIPILMVYLFARRALIRGLMGVGGK